MFNTMCSMTSQTQTDEPRAKFFYLWVLLEVRSYFCSVGCQPSYTVFAHLRG